MEQQKVSAFDRVEGFIRRTLVPVANKVDNNAYLTAIKKGMVVLTPALLLGSVAAIFPSIPEFINAAPVQNWFEQYGYIFGLLSKVSLGLVGLYAVLAIAYFLSEQWKLYTIGSMILSAIGFLLVAMDVDENGNIIPTYLDSKGLFAGIFIAIICVKIYQFFTKHKLVIKMPEGVPDFVSSSFELITPTATIGVLFITVRAVTDALTGGVLLPQVIMEFLAPAIGGLDSLGVIYFVLVLRLVFWFFGIHSAVLSPILSPIAVQYLSENIAAHEAGQPLTHVITGGTLSAFANFTGSGVTMGLVIAMLVSKSLRYKKVGAVALLPSLFGINEPVLFGVPIILNPVLMIPFIFGGAFVGMIPMICMKLGWLNYPIFDPPYVPVFMEGFLTGFDWRAIIIQLVQIGLSFALYLPFFKVLERQELEQEKDVKESHSILSEEDEALLSDLDF
ncbi:PTS sugar transporter subunit IIC [Enterococcus sp. BWB1-3]|uniref:PTS sugar transporter subunit IIC n=1 Tax=unclassified Enterococcus TaxID=2608891 RepID=UPI001922FB0F|nr:MULTISPECIES: PTS transporter subunit EIIC [unclassified Enterococcus]MBL1229176.1 PTS sugar transporter subunit IIC [Enterococcus sp. BWB1-3]MCB5953402.1 PTS transporter subunit EIIC [Enterococcus sp. CWB-B31]